MHPVPTIMTTCKCSTLSFLFFCSYDSSFLLLEEWYLLPLTGKTVTDPETGLSHLQSHNSPAAQGTRCKVVWAHEQTRTGDLDSKREGPSPQGFRLYSKCFKSPIRSLAHFYPSFPPRSRKPWRQHFLVLWHSVPSKGCCVGTLSADQAGPPALSRTLPSHTAPCCRKGQGPEVGARQDHQPHSKGCSQNLRLRRIGAGTPFCHCPLTSSLLQVPPSYPFPNDWAGPGGQKGNRILILSATYNLGLFKWLGVWTFSCSCFLVFSLQWPDSWYLLTIRLLGFHSIESHLYKLSAYGLKNSF